MSSISGITSAASYAASNYQIPAQKPSAPTAQGSPPAAPPARDSIQLSPEGLAALKESTKTSAPEKPTHAQLVLEAASGNPTAKAKLATEKKQEGLKTCK